MNVRGPRSALPVALLAFAAALTLASCSSNDEPPLAPEPEVTDTTTSMIDVRGTPRVQVSLELNLVEATSAGSLTGTVRAILLDSTGARVFLPHVRLNGAVFVDELDGFGNPSLSTLDVATALPDLVLADSLFYVVSDGTPYTPPFTIAMAPPRMELLRDSTVVSKGQDLKFRWSGRVERMNLTLTDQFGQRVRATLTFENFSGLREVTLPARDLAPLAPGPITVGVSITDTEARFAGPRLVSVNYTCAQRRFWTLVPASVTP